MENKILQFLQNQFRDGFFHVKTTNPEEISQPIVDAINHANFGEDTDLSPVVDELRRLNKKAETLNDELINQKWNITLRLK